MNANFRISNADIIRNTMKQLGYEFDPPSRFNHELIRDGGPPSVFKVLEFWGIQQYSDGFWRLIEFDPGTGNVETEFVYKNGSFCLLGFNHDTGDMDIVKEFPCPDWSPN